MIAKLRVLLALTLLATWGAFWVAPATADEPSSSVLKREKVDLADGHEWSEAVGGLQARLELRHCRVENGTPLLATLVHLRNVRNDDSEIRIRWQTAPIEFRLANAAGKEPPAGGSGEGTMAIPPDPVKIPAREGVSIDLTGPFDVHYYPDEVGAIALETGPNWIVRRKDGICALKAVLEIQDEEPVKDPAKLTWHGRLSLPLVTVPLRVPQFEAAVIARQIDELGAKMLTGDGPARASLSLVADPRVTPWYVKALDGRDYWLKLAALDRLARLPGDAAFAAIQRALGTKATDLDVSDHPENAPGMAKHVRGMAAVALARSPHAGAARLLEARWQKLDQDAKVKVVFAWGAMKTGKSQTLLEHASDDADPKVREHSRQFLAARAYQAEKVLHGEEDEP